MRTSTEPVFDGRRSHSFASHDLEGRSHYTSHAKGCTLEFVSELTRL